MGTLRLLQPGGDCRFYQISFDLQYLQTSQEARIGGSISLRKYNRSHIMEICLEQQKCFLEALEPSINAVRGTSRSVLIFLSLTGMYGI
jgi:hypothetical protein